MADNNLRSVRGSWLSTSQENPSPLSLPGILLSVVIWGSNGKTNLSHSAREVAEAQWQHGDLWHSSGFLQGTTPLWRSLGSFSVSVCTLTNAKAFSQNRFSLTCTTNPSPMQKQKEVLLKFKEEFSHSTNFPYSGCSLIVSNCQSAHPEQRKSLRVMFLLKVGFHL